MKPEQRLILHDNLKKKFFKRYWIKRRLISFLLKSTTTIYLLKQFIAFAGSNVIFKKGNVSSYKHRCILSGRSHAVDSKFKMSRFALRITLNDGYLNNIRRSSW